VILVQVTNQPIHVQLAAVPVSANVRMGVPDRRRLPGRLVCQAAQVGDDRRTASDRRLDAVGLGLRLSNTPDVSRRRNANEWIGTPGSGTAMTSN
jgi:hypothetical protein